MTYPDEIVMIFREKYPLLNSQQGFSFLQYPLTDLAMKSAWPF